MALNPAGMHKGKLNYAVGVLYTGIIELARIGCEASSSYGQDIRYDCWRCGSVAVILKSTINQPNWVFGPIIAEPRLFVESAKFTVGVKGFRGGER
jgi:hypothetical protein